MIKINIHYYLWIASFILLTSCSQQSSNKAQGYIEGHYTYIATSVSGVLRQLAVQKGQNVKQGQLLFVLEPQPESDAYTAAVEKLKESTNARDAIVANLAYAKITYERDQILVQKKAIQQSALDDATSTYNATQAQLAQANATIAESTALLAEAKWTSEQKMQYAPVDAVVFDTYYRLGEYTIENQPIISLLAPGNIKAIFYVAESILGRIHLNDKVSVTCAGCQDAGYQGRISFISPAAEYTPPVIYSTETNEKLIYRIEAEFAPQDAALLHPGQPVEVTLL
jgi:HlyD family secretion protein